MSEIELKQPEFAYSVCGQFTKNKERIQKYKETGDTKHIYKNELDKTCFQHGMAYGDFEDLTRRAASDKILRDKAFNISKNPKYDGYERGLASMVYNFFDKKSKGGSANNEIKQNEQLAEELQQPIIKKLKKRTAYSTFNDNNWGADLADMQLISKFNKKIRFLLCVIDIYSKYVWVVPLKNKKGVTIASAFQNILDDSMRKRNKIRVDKGSELYNRSMNSWLRDNNIEMYSTNNEGKSVVVERLIRTLKNKIYKHMTAVSKNVYIDKLDDIVNEYNNTYHRAIKMKPVDVKDNAYIDSSKEVHYKDPKFEVCDHVRI